MAMRRLVAVLAMGLTAGSHGLQVAAQTTPPAPRPAQAATRATEQSAIAAACEKDQRRLLDLLGIKELRHPADNDPKSPYVTNYEESKAKVYRDLPDPLKLKNGKPVTSAKMWWSARRPEIVADFDREVLGKAPANLPKVTWEVVSTASEKFGDVPVVTKRLAGHVDNSAYPYLTVTIDLILVTPANAAGPVPVMLELAFPAEFKVALERPRPSAVTPGMGYYGQAWQDQVLARGWGIAVLSPNSYQADNGAGLTEGIIGLAAKGKPRGLEDWGVLKAWAWGASRALDYFETDKAVDARQVGDSGPLANGQGGAGNHGLRPALCHLLQQFLGRGWRQALPAYFWRADYRPGRAAGVPLGGRELLEIRRADDAGRPAGGQPRVDCTGSAKARIHRGRLKRRGRVREQERRRVGGPDRDVSGGSCRGAGVPAAGQKRPGNNYDAADWDGADRRRSGLPPASGRAYAGAKLGDVSGVCQPIFACTRRCTLIREFWTIRAVWPS